MPAQAVQPEIPPDSSGGRTELLEELGALIGSLLGRDVLEREPGLATVRLEPHGHPAQGLHVLPGQIDRLGRVAPGDGAARVALDLVPTSEPQLALDGTEPPGDSLRCRDGLPQVLHRRVVAADRDDHERRLAQMLAALHSTKFGSEHVAAYISLY